LNTNTRTPTLEHRYGKNGPTPFDTDLLLTPLCNRPLNPHSPPQIQILKSWPRPLLRTTKLASRAIVPLDQEIDVFVLPNALNARTHDAVRSAMVRSVRLHIYTFESLNTHHQQDAHASKSRDFFVPQYQNIVDPNLCVNKDSLTWIPSVWNVTPFGKANLKSRIGNLCVDKDSAMYHAFNSVANAAVPLLARLSTPALLLPGQLQIICKAQRIYLDKEGDEYVYFITHITQEQHTQNEKHKHMKNSNTQVHRFVAL
jgi:hypothetical protein